MEINLKNRSRFDLEKYKELIRQLLKYAAKRLSAEGSIEVVFLHDGENAKNPLGKTAYYLPSKEMIAVYATDRHIKDILRSMAHEFVHHSQKQRGEFEKGGNAEPGYALEDEHLREMEQEAFLKGNMIFRTFEDKLKTQKTEDPEMIELSKRLKDKFGFEFQA